VNAATDKGVYSIGAVARLVGVPTGTLRSWEVRYGLVVPQRTSGDQRLYTRDQLEHLQFIVAQMKDGLSAADAHRALAERPGSVGPPAQTSDAPRIAVVASDRFGADVVDYFLRTEGYAVSLVHEPALVVERVRDHELDAVIFDLQVRGGAAMAVCEQVAALVPVVAMSVLDHRARALEAGAEAFLRKPIEPLLLVSVVRDLLGTSALVSIRQESEVSR
jgi:DNA-binding transcriptional MerR regulator